MSTVTPIVPRLTFAEAAARLEAAKEAEAHAILARHDAEKAVIALIGELPAEGTASREDGGYKVAVTTAFRRTVDADKLAEVASSGAIPEAIGKRLIRWKPELVTRELRYIEHNEPEIYARLAQAITAKPAKPAVKVERVTDGGEAA